MTTTTTKRKKILTVREKDKKKKRERDAIRFTHFITQVIHVLSEATRCIQWSILRCYFLHRKSTKSRVMLARVTIEDDGVADGDVTLLSIRFACLKTMNQHETIIIAIYPWTGEVDRQDWDYSSSSRRRWEENSSLHTASSSCVHEHFETRSERFVWTELERGETV